MVALPSYAYVPGQMPRHPEGRFDDLRMTVRPDMIAEQLCATPAFQAGLVFLDHGFFWEAHEVLEPVWLALPDGPDRIMVQALIQLANARLKQRMARPRAVLRLCRIVEAHLQTCEGRGMVMGQSPAAVRAAVDALRAEIRGDAGDVSNCAI